MAKYLLEFHHLLDDAWYTVRMELSGENFTVKYKDFTEEEEDTVFEASSFTSLADLHALRDRFRPLSAQLQDNECHRVFRSVLVCASHSFIAHDVRFYDSVIDDGTKYAKRSSPHATCLIEDKSSSGTDGEDSFFGGDSNHCAGMMKEDVDFGGGRQLFGFLIDTLDKQLAPSAFMESIHAKISLSVQAYVFPSLPYETHTKGAIVVNCEKMLENLCKFLSSPDHVVVSRVGRPWVVSEKLSQFNTFIGPIHALILKYQNKLHHKISGVKCSNDL